MMDIEAVWGRIVLHEGEIFTQIKGGTFTYIINGNMLLLSRTNRAISKNVILQALEYVPVKSTVPFQQLQAPSYLYAILMDKRICRNLW